jgi:hypothetical protein
MPRQESNLRTRFRKALALDVSPHLQTLCKRTLQYSRSRTVVRRGAGVPETVRASVDSTRQQFTSGERVPRSPTKICAEALQQAVLKCLGLPVLTLCHETNKTFRTAVEKGSTTIANA